MAFSTEQKEALKTIFQEKSFKGYIGGKYVFQAGPKPSTITNFLKELGAPDVFEEVPCLITLALAVVKKTYSSEDILEVVKEWTEENRKELPAVTELDEEDEEAVALGPFLRSLVPTVNISKNAKDKVILLDPSKNYRPVMDVDLDTYYTLTGNTWQDLVCNDAVKKVMTCFDPYTLKYIFKKESKSGSLNIFHVNYYVPPRWRFVTAAPAYEGFIKSLITHLFPNADEREYVLDWLHYALVKRNETVLCLVGARGTGKGILLNNIMSALLGSDYYSLAKQEVLTEKFNKEFLNKRFVFFDEVNISGDKELNKFRAFANSRISMEAKGLDAETIDNYVSMALSSNDKREFRAEPQERRFSVPEVTERPLLELYSEEEIESFCARIAEPESEELAAFGNWLLARTPKNTCQRPLKGKYFFELCRLAMPEWKLGIIDYVIANGEVGVPILTKDIEKEVNRGKQDKDKKYFPRGTTIQIFLGDYTHEARHRIGTLVQEEDKNGRLSPAILPNEEFIRLYGHKYQSNDSGLEAL
jgi:hypothetical protein